MTIRITTTVLLLMLAHALPAAASDYTLGIFGNANEDDTINMQDVTYTELIILEYRDRTDLADGKHDNKINMQDVTQIELVILGKEKELTYIDILGEAETVTKPIERVAVLGYSGPLVMRAIGARDLIVAVPDQFSQNPRLYPVIGNLPITGNCNYASQCNFEQLLSLNVDAIQTNIEARWAIPNGLESKKMFKEKIPGIPLISLNMREPDVLPENVRILGYIYDRGEEAEAFIDWYEGYYDALKTRSEGLSDDEKPRAYFESQHKYKCAASGSRLGVAINLAGGKNIIDGVIGPGDSGYGSITNVIDPEWVMEQNPEFIFKRIFGGYETDDPSKQAAAIQEVMDRPELAMSDAVRNGRVYTVDDFLVRKRN